MKRKKDLLICLFLALCILPRFFGLNNGLVPGEPDEFIHADVAQNFAKSWWPTFSGGGWYFELPLYPFLGYFVSLVFPGRYLGLRLVSAFASLLLTFGFYAYFKYKFSRRLGFIIAFLWAISPFSIYYSRLALLDSWTIAFGMLGLFAFDVAISPSCHPERSEGSPGDSSPPQADQNDVGLRRWAILSGLFLGLAMLVKYTALIYLLVPVVYFGFLSLKETLFPSRTNISTNPSKRHGNNLSRPLGFKKILRTISHLETVDLDLTSFLPPLVVFLMTFPLMVILRQHEPYQFKLQTLTTLGFVRDFWRITGEELTIGDYLRDIPWWLTWPMLVLEVFGILSQVLIIFLSFWKDPERSRGGLIESRPRAVSMRSPHSLDPIASLQDDKLPRVLWLGLFFTCLLVVPHTPFYPRYFLPLVPFIVIFAGVGFEWLVSLVILGRSGATTPESGFWTSQNDKLRFTIYGLLLIISLFILPSSITAFRATQHNLIENTGQYIKDHSKTENPWIFSNYWPHFFGRGADTNRATWLADSAWEAKAFVPDAEKSPLEIIKEEESFVVLEDLYSYSPMFISPPSRTNAWEYVKENYEPTAVIEDNFPNFPHFRSSHNKIVIYQNFALNDSH